MSTRGWARWTLALASASFSVGCAQLVGADFGDKVLCDEDCTGTPDASRDATFSGDAGRAVPTTLAVSDDPLGVLVADEQNVYWVSSVEQGPGQILECAITGCGESPTVLASNQLDPNGIAVDGTNVYWTNGALGSSGGGTPEGQVMACAIAGCNGNPTVLASGQTAPLGIAAANAVVYWTNQGTGNDDGAVMQCAASGCGQSPTVLAGQQNSPTSIVVDGANAYWTNSGTLGTDGQILKCATSGCDQPTVLADGQSTPLYIALDAVNVYWASGDNVTGPVLQCATAGCDGSPLVLAAAVSTVGIAVDATGVYWADVYAPGIASCAIGGCDLHPTLLDDTTPYGIAVGGGNVYFTAPMSAAYQVLSLPE